MENKQIIDSITAGYRKAIDFLFLQNPKETSMGILLGTVLNAFIRVLPFFDRYSYLRKINIFEYVVIGILLLNIRPYYHRPKFDPSIEQALLAIRTEKRLTKLSDLEVKLLYRSIFRQVIDQVIIPEGKQNMESDKLQY